MKKILLPFVAISLLLTSCSKDPIADFVVDLAEPGIGETVYFTNRSMDANSYEWDFGDEFVSNSFNASHYYDMDGTYTVSLKAMYKDRFDVKTLTIRVVDASIIITVEEFYEPFYLVGNISVRLYPTITSWENEEIDKIVDEKFTNDEGTVRFDHLAPKRYYVDVWGPNHNNYDLAAEDAGFIETPVLVPGTITYWTALVDYFGGGKKSGLSRFEAKAKSKIEATGRTPRTMADRNK
jgi:PKD repeat protein